MSHKRSLIVATALLTMSLVAGSAYAEQSQANPPQSQPVPRQGAGSGMMGNGQMMGQGGGMQGMMGMMGMMNMMAQASQMMETCNNLMKTAMQAPNGQWHKPNHTPEKKG